MFLCNVMLLFVVAVAGDVSPQTTVADQAARPAWVEASPALVDGKIYRMTVVVGPYATREECDERLPVALQEAAARYLDRLCGSGASQHLRLTDDYLRQLVLKSQWQESVHSSVGPMVQTHALLEFDDRVRTTVEQLWRDARIQQRLLWLAAGTVGVLAALGIAHLALRRNGRSFSRDAQRALL